MEETPPIPGHGGLVDGPGAAAKSPLVAGALRGRDHGRAPPGPQGSAERRCCWDVLGRMGVGLPTKSPAP